MLLKLSSFLLFAATVLGEPYCPASPSFRMHSILKNTTNTGYNTTTSSFGYATLSFWYAARYNIILDPEDSWTISTVSTSDIFNHSASTLGQIDQRWGYITPFVLNPLSKEEPTGWAEFNGEEGVEATVGVFINDDGFVQYNTEPGCPVKWHGCPHRDPAEYTHDVTQLGYRLYDAAVPEGCFDIDLKAEFMTGWNTPTGDPPKCWEPRS